MEKTTIGVVAAGALVRLLLLQGFPVLPLTLDGRVECSTPISSYKRMKEGIYQYTHGADPYNGGIFHQSPLLLALFSILEDAFGKEEWVVNVLYTVIDSAVAVALIRITHMLKRKNQDTFHPAIIASIYLFNPFTLLSSLSKSTIVFTNASVVLSILAASTSKPVHSMGILALASVLSVYPLYLSPALITFVLQNEQVAPSQQIKRCVFLALMYIGFLGLFIGLSFSVAGNWNFLNSVYGIIFFFSDLTPNIGLWWYFFTEMFEFFRSFFMGVFQIYVAAFSLPVSIRFKDNPIFALATIVGISTVFKSYPEVGDIGIYFTLLALFKPVFPLLKYGLPVTLALLYTMVLAPTFYHLWVYLGSGNSNFFYAITLVYALAMTIVLSDSIWAAIRIQYDGGKNPNLSQI